MGFFDRFKKRVKELADETDLDALTAEEGSEEANEAIATTTPSVEEEWDDISQIEEPVEITTTDDDWDEWDDEPEPQPTANLSKKERKLLERERKRKEKEKKQLAKKGFDVDQVTRPDGSRVDLHMMRSTTGRKLVEVEQAPRMSSGKKTVETEQGVEFDIDLGGGVVEKGGRIIKGGPVFDELLEELELVMLEADMGSRAMEAVLTALRTELIGSRLRKGANLAKVIEASLKRALRSLLAAGYWDFNATIDGMIEAGDTPVIVMMVGVNGTGKTTTTAKIAHRLKSEGRNVVLAAADTFRAGAIDQLETHAERIGVRCVSSERGGDSAAIARDAVESAKARGADVVIVDTAGRMTNKINLMNELQKVHRVAQPHLVLFVGDALAGNDAVEQAVEFQRMLKFDGAVLCKLDTDAKGGAALSIAHATGRPIVLAGIGQEYDDLKQFDPDWLLQMMFE
ncbi:MAG: signal recognition particle-docking protein FtsY [Marine Group II euryarchaeote MED-G33]|nr:MAG: signal recognition particle-docking protein FtsY [Marine Group II euryarchaeote MED-G33]|tara:strand:+ start:2798 stop:4165 length:1368 start_codon:yes stop_codon:yes gene_type:complete